MGNFNMLPSEIIADIVSRLPTEFVLECKLVSKPWKNVIQDRPFSQLHLNQLNQLDSGKDLSFIFDTRGSDEEEPFCFTYTEYNEELNCFSRTSRIRFRPPFSTVGILGSCNGLICFNVCLDYKLDARGQPAYEPVCISNPVTREYILLPKYEGKDLLTGFGYVSSTNEYKVVRICNERRDPNFGVVQVYTLGSGVGWRTGVKVDYEVNLSRVGEKSGVFVNGDIYWLDDRGTIAAFSLANEESREVPSLPWWGRNRNPRTISKLHVLGGYLCAYACYDKGFDIWVLKKNQNYHDVCIWSKEVSNVLWNDKPITFTKTGGLLCCNGDDKNVYHYTPEALSCRTLVKFGKNFEFGVPHKNTLVSLKALGEEDTKVMDLGERANSSGIQKTVMISPRKLRNGKKRKISG